MGIHFDELVETIQVSNDDDVQSIHKLKPCLHDTRLSIYNFVYTILVEKLSSITSLVEAALFLNYAVKSRI